MLRNHFPKSDTEAEIYGGALENPDLFYKVFHIQRSIEESLASINSFLNENGYEPIATWNGERGYKCDMISVSIQNKEALVLSIENRKYDLKEVVKELIAFRDERDWKQFHSSKDLAIAISLEANELLEQFLWKGNEEVAKEKLEEELADVFSFCLLLAEKHNLNVAEMVSRKISRNAEKYPVAKAKGTAKKYNEL